MILRTQGFMGLGVRVWDEGMKACPSNWGQYGGLYQAFWKCRMRGLRAWGSQ